MKTVVGEIHVTIKKIPQWISRSQCRGFCVKVSCNLRYLTLFMHSFVFLLLCISFTYPSIEFLTTRATTQHIQFNALNSKGMIVHTIVALHSRAFTTKKASQRVLEMFCIVRCVE